MNDEPYELETTVRSGRSKLWLVLSILPSLAFLAIGLKIGVLFFLFPLPVVIGFLAKRTEHAKVVASRDGLRIGERLVPRSALKGALVRHEGDHTFVALRGDRDIDIQVKNNVEGDALVQALGLDARSATLEVAVNAPLTRGSEFLVMALIIGPGMLVAMLAREAWLGLPIALIGVLASGFVGRARVRIGADGLVIRRPWGTSTFVSHEDIEDLSSDGSTIVVRRRDGREIRLSMQTTPSDEVDGIARRILQARRTHLETAFAPELSAALDPGSRTTREWMTELRRLGEGAASTFRTIGVAREQLLDVIESTTASTKDRIAALVALRKTLREEEKTRIRVATDRIAKAEVRERLVRVLDASDDEALEEELEALREAFSSGEREP